jgi:hypothetical protein
MAQHAECGRARGVGVAHQHQAPVERTVVRHLVLHDLDLRRLERLRERRLAGGGGHHDGAARVADGAPVRQPALVSRRAVGIGPIGG